LNSQKFKLNSLFFDFNILFSFRAVPTQCTLDFDSEKETRGEICHCFVR